MTELIAVPLDGGGILVVEAAEGHRPPEQIGGGVVKAGRPGDLIRQTTQSLEAALEPVTVAAKSVMSRLREAGPDQVTVEFGLLFTAEVGAVITKTAAECNLKVTLRWDRGDEPVG